MHTEMPKQQPHQPLEENAPEEKEKLRRRSRRELNVGQRIESADLADAMKNPVEHMHFAAAAMGLTDRGEITKEDAASVLSKLNAFVQQGPQGARPHFDTPQEQEAYERIMGAHSRGARNTVEFSREFPEAQVSALLNWAAEHTHSGFGARLYDKLAAAKNDPAFIANIVRTVAYNDPGAFDELRKNMMVARNLTKQDEPIERALKKFAEANGIGTERVLRIVEADDWKAQLQSLAKEHNRGGHIRNRWSGITTGLSKMGLQYSANFTTWENFRHFAGGIEEYRSRAKQRKEALGGIANVITQLSNGSAGPAITNATFEVVHRSDIKPETKAAYEYVKTAKPRLQAIMNDDDQIAKRWKALGTPAADLDTPAGVEKASRAILNAGSKQLLGSAGPDRGGFLADLWKFMDNFFGALFGTAEVEKVSAKLKDLKAAGTIA